MLTLKAGRERSKELRGTMFTDPARAAPSDSGVGEKETSMRDRLLVVNTSMAVPRPAPPSPPLPIRLAVLKPPIVTGT